ncbi:MULTISPECIES: alpha/beta fold hydrolase [unclassified Ochrobactrum]|uniref:alpha/beta hydrolase n=1 Tax=unclassified Ochrobactrum TaxID=239106 RepID=UPI000DEF7988|nr:MULTISPECIES: alpha/beta fold hydrolase [unclassified Ochrobactrum]MBQ0708118.1 alpha/beta fold hydrolase [Ochrobactrum sp. AP1BH01-1]
MKQVFILAFVLLVAAGCAGNRAVTGLGRDVAGQARSGTVVPFAVATVRERIDDPSIAYSRNRSPILNFSTIDVHIPEIHRPGNVETASVKPAPRRHFTASNYAPLPDRRAMIAELNRRLASRPASQREIFVFVHGYNNNFAEGLFRNAQIVHDYGVSSVPVHFSWASAASFTRYLYDRDSAIVARRGLAETLAMAAQTKADGIVVVGHSMGAVAVMEALRTLSGDKRGDVLKHIRGVLLAAPDIDPDLFRSQIDDIDNLPQPFTIIVSRRDRALDISRRLAGGAPRVGSGFDIAFLQNKNIQVLDISEVDSGGHSLSASSNTLIKLLGSGHLLRRLITDEYASMDDSFLAVGQGTFEQASLALHLPARVIDRLGAF